MEKSMMDLMEAEDSVVLDAHENLPIDLLMKMVENDKYKHY